MSLVRAHFRTPSPPPPTLPEQFMEEQNDAAAAEADVYQRDSPLSPRPESQASTTLDMDDSAPLDMAELATDEQLPLSDSDDESRDNITFPSDDEDYLLAVDNAMRRERALQNEIAVNLAKDNRTTINISLKSAQAFAPSGDPAINKIRTEVLEDIAKQMETIFECPVCLETPRPMTTTMGFCVNGHLFCTNCTLQLHDQTNNLCPVCRAPHVFISHYNMFIKKMFSLLGSFAVSKCEFEFCPFFGLGKDMFIHERFCCFRPVTCPRCQTFGIFPNVFWGDHNCFALCEATCTKPMQLQLSKTKWEFAMDVADFMDLNSDDIIIKQSVKPILLRIQDDTDFRAYVYPMYDIVYNYLVFNVRWLALKAYTDYTVQRQKYKIKVSMSTQYGTMSKGCLVRPMFHCESLTGTDHDGVRLKKHEIRSWISMANIGNEGNYNHLCKECHSAKLVQTPHIHIQVELME